MVFMVFMVYTSTLESYTVRVECLSIFLSCFIGTDGGRARARRRDDAGNTRARVRTRACEEEHDACLEMQCSVVLGEVFVGCAYEGCYADANVERDGVPSTFERLQ